MFTSPIPGATVRSPFVMRRRGGFTIIEVLIVLAIIVAIIGLVAVNVFGRRDEAKKDLVKTDMGSLKSALRLFRLDYDRYPTDEEGLAVLWSKDALSADADQNKWKKYLESPLPNDQYGTAWGYRQISENGDESEFDLWSFGPDKQEGTDDDITSWTKSEGTDAGTSGTAPAGDSKSGS